MQKAVAIKYLVFVEYVELNTTLLGGALRKVLTNASMLLDAAYPDPAAAEFDELGIGRGMDGSRRRHCLSGPESDSPRPRRWQ